MEHYDGGVAVAGRVGHRLSTGADPGDHEVCALGGDKQLDSLVDRYLVEGELPRPGAAVPGATARPGVPAGR